MILEKQNILFLTRTMKPGGTENVILQLCEILKPEVNKIIVCSCGGILTQKLEEMGIRHYEIEDIQNKSPKSILQTIRKLKKVVTEEKITVIHSHHRMAAMYAQFISGKKILKIANAHNTFFDKKKFTQWAYKDTKLIAVGEMVKKNLTDFYGVPDSQVTVIRNAIKPFDEKVEFVKEIQDAREAGYITIGNIGRLSEQKGMEYYLKAAKKALEQRRDIRFFLIGDGEDREKLEDMINHLFLNGEMKMLGYRNDVQNVISQLDFIVLSSLWEGLPLTPIEAFSVGKTIVATSVDGTVEIVSDKVNGLLVEAANTGELAEAILKLCNDKNMITQYGRNAYDTYKELFTFEQMKKRYIAFYKQV